MGRQSNKKKLQREERTTQPQIFVDPECPEYEYEVPPERFAQVREYGLVLLTEVPDLIDFSGRGGMPLAQGDLEPEEEEGE